MFETATTTTASLTPVYRHSKSDDWGMAILAWERGPRRGYQFEDGEMRVFRKGYYHMLEPVDLPVERRAAIVPKLDRMCGASPARTEAVAKNAPDALSQDDQLRVFSIEYPDGFDDPAWKLAKRGSAAKRSLKRHRDPVIGEAKEKLSRGFMDAAIERGDFCAVRDAALEVLEATDLTTAAQRKPLAQMDDSRARMYALALRDLLYRDGSFDIQFEQLIASMARPGGSFVGWQLATALPALIQPEQHICVRPSAFRKQLAALGRSIAVPRSPSAKVYGQLQDVATGLRDQLEALGQSPHDLFDIYDFMVETQRPSARKLLEH